jgi:hypothetical protein
MMDIFSFFDLPNLETLETKEDGESSQPTGRRNAPTEDGDISHADAHSVQPSSAHPAKRSVKSDTHVNGTTASQVNIDGANTAEMSSNYVFWMVP